MATNDDISKFFAEVYKDRKLQGALHTALVASAPEVVVEIAKSKGFKFSKQELGSALAGDSKSGELSDDALQGAVGGALSLSGISQKSLQLNFWGRFVNPGGLAGAFGLTIPGPSFVNVQAPEDRELQEISDEPEAEGASAVDVYKELVGK